jgi:hypothetical protein
MTRQYLASCVAAFLFAALTPALILAGLAGSIQLAPIAFFVSLGHAILLGLPLFLILRSTRWINAISSTVGGFIVGVIPGAFLSWPWSPGSATSVSIRGVPTIVDGIPTAAGWAQYVEISFYLGCFGAVGGFVFWLVLKLCGGLAKTTKVVDHDARPASFWSLGSGFVVVAILLTGAVVAVPSITRDRTCHNKFRDGLTTIAPKASMYLQVADDDWTKLRKTIEDFSAKRELSLRDYTRTGPDIVPLLAVSLCDDRGTNISVNEQHWALREFTPPIAGRGVGFIFYEVRANSGWEVVARDLVNGLEAAWPGRIHFRDGNNRVIPIPAQLKGRQGSGVDSK